VLPCFRQGCLLLHVLFSRRNEWELSLNPSEQGFRFVSQDSRSLQEFSPQRFCKVRGVMLSYIQRKDFPFRLFSISVVQQATLIGCPGVVVVPNEFLQTGAETSSGQKL